MPENWDIVKLFTFGYLKGKPGLRKPPSSSNINISKFPQTAAYRFVQVAMHFSW